MTGHQVFGFGQLTDTAELPKPPQRPAEPPSECPRCCSTNTKFCYYNNYNKSQPRHFCKSCKRHWTKGGTLRSIPAGRRCTNKRAAAAIAAHPEPQPPRKNKIQKLLSFATDHKNMSNILYQALIQSPPSTNCFNFIVPQGTILESHGTTHAAGLNASARRNHPNTEFTYSSYYQSSNDSAAESTVTTSAAPPCTASNLGAAGDVADLWNWNSQIDSLAGSADFNLVWDHLKFDF